MTWYNFKEWVAVILMWIIFIGAMFGFFVYMYDDSAIGWLMIAVPFGTAVLKPIFKD